MPIIKPFEAKIVVDKILLNKPINDTYVIYLMHTHPPHILC